MTIVEFLEARIAEDETGAHERAVTEWFDGGWPSEHCNKIIAECAAKRAIIGEHGCDSQSYGDYCETCAEWWRSEVGEGPPGVSWPCATLKALAAVYSDHPEFQEEWAS